MIDTPPAAWDQQGDPYWSKFYANEPKGKTATFTVLDECRSWDSTPYYDLLNKKVAEAEASLKAELHAQLYGRKPESNPLRQAIADAYDQVTHEAAISRTLSTYKDQISKQIFMESPILAALNRQEKDVTENRSVAQAAMDKRREKKAKAVVELLGDFLDDEHWEDGDTIAWVVNFHSNPDKTYHYVALKGGYHWYVTGTATRYTNDELVVKLTTLALEGRVVIDSWDDPL